MTGEITRGKVQMKPGGRDPHEAEGGVRGRDPREA